MTACLPPSFLNSLPSSQPHAQHFPGCLSSRSLNAPANIRDVRTMPIMQADYQQQGPLSRTTSPIVTGASVLAVQYADGVMMMADTMGSYGSMGMFKGLSRLHEANSHTLIGGGGEYSDFQYILRLLESLRVNDFNHNDGQQLSAQQIHAYLGRVMYARRSKINPLWNQIITAGFKDGKSFLGFTDLYGSTYEAPVLASGYGLHLAIPLLRKHARVDMSGSEARALLEDCMRVLFYRDCRTINSFQIATVTQEGINISKPFSVSTSWEMKRQVQPNSAE